MATRQAPPQGPTSSERLQHQPRVSFAPSRPATSISKSIPDLDYQSVSTISDGAMDEQHEKSQHFQHGLVAALEAPQSLMQSPQPRQHTQKPVGRHVEHPVHRPRGFAVDAENEPRASAPPRQPSPQRPTCFLPGAPKSGQNWATQEDRKSVV